MKFTILKTEDKSDSSLSGFRAISIIKSHLKAKKKKDWKKIRKWSGCGFIQGKRILFKQFCFPLD